MIIKNKPSLLNIPSAICFIGMKVIIGRWLLTNPEVLLLDEPTRGIDVGAKYEIYQLIINLAKQGKTIIMVTHDPQMASYCSRLILLKDGVILEDLKNSGDQELFYQEKKF